MAQTIRYKYVKCRKFRVSVTIPNIVTSEKRRCTVRLIPKSNPAVSWRYYRWVLQAQPFLFARFENAPSESEEVVESRVEVLPAEPSTGHRGHPGHPVSAAFDNPMYGNTKVRRSCALSSSVKETQLPWSFSIYAGELCVKKLQ